MEFIETTEIDERSLRRLAASRGCSLARNDASYCIEGACFGGVTLSDDECWDTLACMPQVETLGGKGRLLSSTA